MVKRENPSKRASYKKRTDENNQMWPKDEDSDTNIHDELRHTQTEPCVGSQEIELDPMSQEEKSDDKESSTTEYLEEDPSIRLERTQQEEAEMEEEWKKKERPQLAEISKVVRQACQDNTKTPELKGFLCAKKIKGIMEKGGMLRSWKDGSGKK